MINAIEKAKQDNEAREVVVWSRVFGINLTAKVTSEWGLEGQTASHPGMGKEDSGARTGRARPTGGSTCVVSNAAKNKPGE